MHNCRKMENQFLDLLFDDVDAAAKRRLLREIEGCAVCAGRYHSLSDTLLVVERTTKAALPPENYWPSYNAALRHRLRAPFQPTAEVKASRAPLWRRLLATKLPIPVPVAAALVIGLIISSALAFGRGQVRQTSLASSPLTGPVRVIAVPVVQERVIMRTVYVEKKQSVERGQRPALPVAVRANEIIDSTVASGKHEDETGFFTRANLKGFQPADEMKIRVLKRNNANDK